MSELTDLLDEAQDGPWRPEPPLEDDYRKTPSFWLTNYAGDSLIIDPATAALLLNAALSQQSEKPGEQS